MKFLLIMHINPAIMEELTEAERQEIMDGHGTFMKTTRESGEMIGTEALADPSQSSVVRVRDGVPVVTDGPYLEAKEFLGGYYLVDVASRDRALELAAMIPDARFNGLGIEVRQVIFSGGPTA
ncbi:YciI family protein [Streptomyces sp. NPDC051658]|uniref:YciI family protein n=1 Tax=unclassified Streptomyces TaxID=2593676 RepID=UPI002F9181BC|nr:YciI family protein [Streptomyces sp. NBC_00984]